MGLGDAYHGNRNNYLVYAVLDGNEQKYYTDHEPVFKEGHMEFVDSKGKLTMMSLTVPFVIREL